MTLKKSQQSLKKWGAQKWRYSSKGERKKPKSERGRYLPDAAWKSLSAGERVNNIANNLKRLQRRQGVIENE